jgi:hypothetical protein
VPVSRRRSPPRTAPSFNVPSYRANPAVVETDLPEELILLDPATREMFSLNATGRIVWRALAERGETDGRALAIARITKEF